MSEKDDKLIDMLYNQLTDHANSIQRALTVIEQLRQSDVDKAMKCTKTKTNFTLAINKLTSFMSSIQNQTEVLIKEVKSMKASVTEHDKKLFMLDSDYKNLIKDYEKTDSHTTKLQNTTESLSEKINKQEPMRLLIILICTFILAVIGLINSWSGIIKNLEAFFSN